MTHITRTNLTVETAKAIITAFYNADKSSSYLGERHHRLNGNCVNVHIHREGAGWTVDVSSFVWMPATCNEIINSINN